MTDRKLLELAAKAAGIACDSEGPFTSVDRYDLYNGIYTEYLPWNPLTDDGDALRLAVKLNLLFPSSARLMYFLTLERFSRQGDNDTVATRSAIVRAAAEIGKFMP